MDADADPTDTLAASARRGGVRVRIGVGAGVVLLIAALAVAVAISAFTPRGTSRTVTAMTAATGAPGGSATPGPTDAPGRDPAATPPSTAPPPLFVHVLGAVRDPGLFQVASGARVVDAVAAAGGFADDANQGGVNLARVIADGEQIVVPRVGEDLPPPASGAAGGGAGASGAAGAGGAATTPVNINTATTAQLETLPRIGPAMAQRIVDWRTANGRFTSVDDLLSVTGIGQKTLDGFRDLVRL